MSLQFYNTLNKKIEPFQEIKKGEVGLYTCGPTVYDYAHIGNFRSYMFEDLVKRYLLYLGYKVKHVMNITDIDDKTIKKANEQKKSLSEISDYYSASFFNDLETLEILRADHYPKATDHINEMIALVQKLEEKGYAYVKGHSVYFSIEKFKNYGKLANISQENLRIGSSVDSDEYDKEHVQDFVLWKEKKAGEPFWSTPYGDGRPGWHIECSAMSMKYLGEHFDIHMGGVDNIFPHHENEIAQSQAATGKPFVNYWIHCQHLIVNNQKMSKSLGNFYTLKDLLDQGYDPLAIRYLLLSTHYRKLLNFTLPGLKSAKQTLKRINDFIFSLKNLKNSDGETRTVKDLIQKNEEEFKENMNDDFNIAGALGVLFEFIHQINLNLNQLKKGDVSHILAYMKKLNQILGIMKSEGQISLDSEILNTIKKRELARKEKNFQLADQIRNELQSKGIILIDTPDGVTWKMEK